MTTTEKTLLHNLNKAKDQEIQNYPLNHNNMLQLKSVSKRKYRKSRFKHHKSSFADEDEDINPNDPQYLHLLSSHKSFEDKLNPELAAPAKRNANAKHMIRRRFNKEHIDHPWEMQYEFEPHEYRNKLSNTIQQ